MEEAEQDRFLDLGIAGFALGFEFVIRTKTDLKNPGPVWLAQSFSVAV